MLARFRQRGLGALVTLFIGAISAYCRLCGFCGNYKDGYFCERQHTHNGFHYAQDRGYRVVW